MVLGGVVIDEERVASLKAIDVKDSKLLSANKREILYEKILRLVDGYKIIIISPEKIDEAVESVSSNLNTLEAITFAQLINFLKPDVAIVDCPSTNIRAYTEQLKIYLKNPVNLRCEHKAEKYPVVAAASILAKVTRDREMEKIREEYKVECGSGYPADPLTQRFLKENWNKYPELFRKSWSTYRAYSEPKRNKSLSEF